MSSVLPPGVNVDAKTALVNQLMTFNLTQDRLTSLLLDDKPNWAFRNMYVYAGADIVTKASLNARPALYNFHSIANMWLIMSMIMIAAFFILGNFFHYCPGLRQRYLALKKEERLVAVYHAMFVVTFVIKIVPQTIWTCHLLFGPSFALQFNNNYKRLWCCAISTALLYVSEGSARSIIRRNPFLVVHHIFYFLLFMLPIVRDSLWGSKLILLLDCFIVLSELPLYISLLAHRFMIDTKKVKLITYACCVWSFAIRVLEIVILIAYFAGTRKRMAYWGETQMWGWFLAFTIPLGVLTVLYSFGIFWWFLHKRDNAPDKYGPGRFNIQKADPAYEST